MSQHVRSVYCNLKIVLLIYIEDIKSDKKMMSPLLALTEYSMNES